MVFVDTKFLLYFSPFMLFLGCEKGAGAWLIAFVL